MSSLVLYEGSWGSISLLGEIDIDIKIERPRLTVVVGPHCSESKLVQYVGPKVMSMPYWTADAAATGRLKSQPIQCTKNYTLCGEQFPRKLSGVKQFTDEEARLAPFRIEHLM